MDRRKRIDSSTAAVEVMSSSLTNILPPEHCPLPEDAMPFWDAIARGRMRVEWESTPALLVTASNLAWTQWQIVKLRRAIEDAAVPDAKAISRMSDLQRLEMAYLRTLQQNGRATEGEARDVGKRRAQANEIADNNPLANDIDDLLARPTVQ